MWRQECDGPKAVGRDDMAHERADEEPVGHQESRGDQAERGVAEAEREVIQNRVVKQRLADLRPVTPDGGVRQALAEGSDPVGEGVVTEIPYQPAQDQRDGGAQQEPARLPQSAPHRRAVADRSVLMDRQAGFRVWI